MEHVVSSSDRVAAALLRIDYAEEILQQARKILEYEEKQVTGGACRIPEPCEVQNTEYLKEPECEE
jgi:hypothetical protein